MNNIQPLNWQMFREQLLLNPELDLQFQYGENKWVATSYHITEIKQAPITSVDCGGVMNKWTEIIIQLWEPEGKPLEKPMKVRKALSIIDTVERKLPLNPEGIVKIEFGNSAFDTRQMFPGNISSYGENLVVDLQPDFTQCKAINRGGSCDPGENDEECCVSEKAKPEVHMKTLAVASCCVPGSGCC